MPTCLDRTHYYRDPELEGDPIEEAILDLQKRVGYIEEHPYQHYTNPTYNYYWHVDAIDGSDENDGKTSQTAWRTLGHAFRTLINEKTADARIRLRGCKESQTAPVEYELDGYNHTFNGIAFHIVGVSNERWKAGLPHGTIPSDEPQIEDQEILDGDNRLVRRWVKIRFPGNLNFYQCHLNFKNIDWDKTIEPIVQKRTPGEFYYEACSIAFTCCKFSCPIIQYGGGAAYNTNIFSALWIGRGHANFRTPTCFDDTNWLTYNPGVDYGQNKQGHKIHVYSSTIHINNGEGIRNSIRMANFNPDYTDTNQAQPIYIISGSVISIDDADHDAFYWIGNWNLPEGRQSIYVKNSTAYGFGTTKDYLANRGEVAFAKVLEIDKNISITDTVGSSSTQYQVPTAKAVHQALQD